MLPNISGFSNTLCNAETLCARSTKIGGVVGLCAGGLITGALTVAGSVTIGIAASVICSGGIIGVVGGIALRKFAILK